MRIKCIVTLKHYCWHHLVSHVTNEKLHDHYVSGQIWKYIVSLSIYILQDAFIRKVNHYIAIYARWQYMELVGGDIGAASTQECLPLVSWVCSEVLSLRNDSLCLAPDSIPKGPCFFPWWMHFVKQYLNVW